MTTVPSGHPGLAQRTRSAAASAAAPSSRRGGAVRGAAAAAATTMAPSVDQQQNQQQGQQQQQPQQGFKGHVLVVGAGPAGLTSALLFAQRGFRVTVAERRGDPASPEAAAAAPLLHTYPMAVNPRATAAIDATGARPRMLEAARAYEGSADAATGRLLFAAAPAGGAETPEAARLRQSFLVDQVGLCREVRAGLERGL